MRPSSSYRPSFNPRCCFLLLVCPPFTLCREGGIKGSEQLEFKKKKKKPCCLANRQTHTHTHVFIRCSLTYEYVLTLNVCSVVFVYMFTVLSVATMMMGCHIYEENEEN